MAFGLVHARGISNLGYSFGLIDFPVWDQTTFYDFVGDGVRGDPAYYVNGTPTPFVVGPGTNFPLAFTGAQSAYAFLYRVRAFSLAGVNIVVTPGGGMPLPAINFNNPCERQVAGFPNPLEWSIRYRAGVAYEGDSLAGNVPLFFNPEMTGDGGIRVTIGTYFVRGVVLSDGKFVWNGQYYPAFNVTSSYFNSTQYKALSASPPYVTGTSAVDCVVHTLANGSNVNHNVNLYEDSRLYTSTGGLTLDPHTWWPYNDRFDPTTGHL